MNEQRIQDWLDGKVTDDDLTKKEVKWLEKRVFKAIAAKMLATPGKIVFCQHETLQ